MAVEWTDHRFVGGALALDVANTVVLRGDPAKTFDRFDQAMELGYFATAATKHRADELEGRALRVANPVVVKPRMLALREAIDALFRNMVHEAGIPVDLLPPLLNAGAECISSGGPADESRRELALETATALSAINLLAAGKAERIRICDNCRWLFLDRSRNASRRWCDMTVCGNRIKAQRHYEKKQRRSPQ